MTKRIHLIGAVLVSALSAVHDAAGAERLCDSSIENCRIPLRDLIRAETQGIDVAFWFMEDSRYTTDLIAAHNRGVPIRVLVDTKANTNYPYNATMIGYLRDAGIPIRRITSSWLHWKLMLFAGQNVVQFGSANYSPHAFVPVDPLVNFIDEAIFFSDDPGIVNSFKRRFDDAWVSTSRFTNYANVSGALTRSYPLYSTSSALNFPPFQDFGARSVARYNAETVGIDVMQFRLGDRRHADAIIAARQRGVPVRIYIEQGQYRDPKRPLSAYDTDRLYAAGVQLRQRNHAGWQHQKLTLLHGQRVAIFGSQNWTHTSGQYEHNYFTTKQWIYDWFRDQFTRKWNSTAESRSFVPQPPNTPQSRAPANGSAISSTAATIRWYAGLWAHKYDIHFGTSSNPPRIASDVELGYSRSSSDLKSYTVSGLTPGTTYYWRIVSKTMANVARAGTVWRFSTTGSAGGGALPSGWLSGDIGSAAPGSTHVNGATITMEGNGAGIWGTSDGFRFAYTQWTGDGTITVHLRSVERTSTGAKAGVMFRESLSAGSKHVSGFVYAYGGVVLQRRSSTSGTSHEVARRSGTAPEWLRLTRAGDTFTLAASADGVNWATVGQTTVTVPSAIYVGLPVTSRVAGTLATAVFESVNLSSGLASTSLPSGWQTRDIGSVGATGSASSNAGTFTVRGSGDDIWGVADAFHFAYRSLSGDGTIVARVASLVGSEAWTKVGVMIRSSTTANAAYAYMLVSKAKGLAYQRHRSTGIASVHTSGGSGTAPRWVRLTRAGGAVSAYRSNDGRTWSLVGTDTVSLPSIAIVGLAVTSHAAGSLATGAFDNVSVSDGS